MKAVRYVSYGLGALAALALVAVVAIYGLSEKALGARVAPRPSQLAAPTAAQLADAPRQLKISGCTGCHAEGMRGQLFFDEPGLAKIYAPNVALLARSMSDEQLERSIRQGIGHDGRSLFIMPSQQYQFLTDQEVAAMIRAIRALPPGGSAQPAMSLGPMGRVGLAMGKFETAPALVAAYRAERLADLGPAHAVGRHIVEVNCTECHGALLKGREIKPGTVSPDLALVAGYDADQFRRLLRNGVAPSGKDLGLMAEVAKGDLSHLTDEEIDAVHAYLVARAK